MEDLEELTTEEKLREIIRESLRIVNDTRMLQEDKIYELIWILNEGIDE